MKNLKLFVPALAVLLMTGCVSKKKLAEVQGNYDNNMTKQELMRRAIALAVENVKQGGGPFGVVIARNGEIVAEGVNRVTLQHDPTAHAEVQAIRNACTKLGTFDLSGCDIYSSCEPCPMCLGAIYWAHLSRLYFAGKIGSASCRERV